MSDELSGKFACQESRPGSTHVSCFDQWRTVHNQRPLATAEVYALCGDLVMHEASLCVCTVHMTI